MKKRPSHHPPLAAPVHRPTGREPGYIYGANGVLGFGCRDFYVAAIPRREAVEMILANHYSRRVVQNSYVHLGVYVGGELLGALQLGYAMNPKYVGKVVANTGVTEHLELNRMWLDDRAPRNSESRALSFTMKYLKRATPSVRWVQSFADERCGCLGVVYQAANFLYLGSHLTTFLELDGETYHPMLLTAHGKSGQRGRHLREHIDRAIRHKLRQFRYIYFLKPAARKDLRMRPRAYPKPAPG